MDIQQLRSQQMDHFPPDRVLKPRSLLSPVDPPLFHRHCACGQINQTTQRKHNNHRSVSWCAVCGASATTTKKLFESFVASSAQHCPSKRSHSCRKYIGATSYTSTASKEVQYEGCSVRLDASRRASSPVLPQSHAALHCAQWTYFVSLLLSIPSALHPPHHAPAVQAQN